MPTTQSVHITDLFFQEEIARAAGGVAGDLKINPVHSPRSMETSSPRSCRALLANNEKGRELSRCSVRPAATQISCESNYLYDRDVAEELGDRIGLLYTDAAHTVLSDLRLRRNSI